MADASSDNLDEHFVVFDGPQSQILQSPVLARDMFGSRGGSNDCACSLGGSRHCLISGTNYVSKDKEVELNFE